MISNAFDVLITSVVPHIINAIIDISGRDELVIIDEFFQSKVYNALVNEESELWHFGIRALAQLFEEERLTGNFTYPEVV